MLPSACHPLNYYSYLPVHFGSAFFVKRVSFFPNIFTLRRKGQLALLDFIIDQPCLKRP